MKKIIVTLTACVLITGCVGGGSSGDVMDKVLTDFGIREPGEDYVQPSDKVYARLDTVGKTELDRMNAENRFGEVKFEESEALGGGYYKERKVYENYYPLEASRMSRTSQSERGYVGYIDYSYRIYQSERVPSRTEAQALSADIPTGDRGRETYRYNFGPAGDWSGAEGERTNR